jgi:hypothetical protein
MSGKYRTLDELKFEAWDGVRIRVSALTDHEASMVYTLYPDSFSIHHSIYKRRKIDYHDQTKAEKSTATEVQNRDQTTQTGMQKVWMD